MSAAESLAEERHITVYIMGKAYEVPAEATIMGAIEYAGHQIIRGAGCREGYCGACATIYRLPGDYKIRTGLA
ncbi:MAG: 2Fe-2S iron-sulfur cluster binding domain-containing protein, partial [Sulfuricella sp.]